MLLSGYLKLAFNSLRTSKWRSLLTMLGIIIGIVSVVTTLSLGEGVKRQLTMQINQRGNDVITVLPGRPLVAAQLNDSQSLTLLSPQASTLLSDADYKIVAQVKEVRQVVPFAQVVGAVKTPERAYAQAQIIATTDSLPTILNQKLEFGSFFKDSEVSSNSAVIGRHVAEQLFKENVPLGKTFTLRDHEFIVRGVFDEFVGGGSLFTLGDYNNAIFIPYKTGQEIMGGSLQISQILLRPNEGIAVEPTIGAVTEVLKQHHAGQVDFSVLRQEQSRELAVHTLSLLTGLIAVVAAISLLVGGIGIMNIMLVAVTERTVEIGVRKALGATNRQILYQFMTEAALLSLSGGLLGVLCSILANFLIRIFTDLQPVITLPVVLMATATAVGIGLFFGIMPALTAARKDPIVALRHE